MKETQPKVLDRSRPRISVLDRDLEEIMRFLRGRLKKKGVREAYLFGSLASQNASAWSDVDLIIVQESNLPFIERIRQYDELLEIGIPVDVLVYTPEEFSQLWSSDSGFWKEVRKSSLRLI